MITTSIYKKDLEFKSPMEELKARKKFILQERLSYKDTQVYCTEYERHVCPRS
ncbi:unnamed protein product [Musa textilis]